MAINGQVLMAAVIHLLIMGLMVGMVAVAVEQECHQIRQEQVVQVMAVEKAVMVQSLEMLQMDRFLRVAVVVAVIQVHHFLPVRVVMDQFKFISGE
jgi:hypothetical protein